MPNTRLQPAGKNLPTTIQIGQNSIQTDGKVYFGRLHCVSDNNYWQVTQTRKEFFIGDPHDLGIYPKNGITLTLRSKPENIQLKKWIREKCLSRSANIFDIIPEDVVEYILHFLYSYWLVPSFVHLTKNI
jgi:hypothetical protein